jgi:hypothetical protein
VSPEETRATIDVVKDIFHPFTRLRAPEFTTNITKAVTTIERGGVGMSAVGTDERAKGVSRVVYGWGFHRSGW